MIDVRGPLVVAPMALKPQRPDAKLAEVAQRHRFGHLIKAGHHHSTSRPWAAEPASSRRNDEKPAPTLITYCSREQAATLTLSRPRDTEAGATDDAGGSWREDIGSATAARRPTHRS